MKEESKQARQTEGHEGRTKTRMYSLPRCCFVFEIDIGELLRSWGFLTSEPKSMHPQLSIADVPPRPGPVLSKELRVAGSSASTLITSLAILISSNSFSNRLTSTTWLSTGKEHWQPGAFALVTASSVRLTESGSHGSCLAENHFKAATRGACVCTRS